MLFKVTSLCALLALEASTTGGVAATPSTGCANPGNLTSGSYTTAINAKEREYIVRVPEGYDSANEYPLIIAYHWFGASAFNVTQNSSKYGNGSYYGLVEQANETAIFVAPNGLDAGWYNVDDEDMAFTDAIVQTIDDELCVDVDQRFIVGFSFGGSMTNAVANSGRGASFKAAAVLSGTIFTPWEGEAVPMGFMVSHGVSDPGNLISTGRIMRDLFVDLNGCADTTAAEPTPGSDTHIKTEYANCTKPVTFIAFDGVHEYSPVDAGASSSWVPGEIWSFFSSD